MRWLLLGALTVLAACSAQRVGEQEERATGASAAATGNMLWLAAERPGLSRVGKDYLFAGPMSVNRSGSSERMLYLALGTTIDRRITGADEPILDTVVFNVDGSLMTFDLISWEWRGDLKPFDPAIEARSSYAAPVTGSQLRALSRAANLTAWVTDNEGRSPQYELVGGEATALLRP